MRNTESESLLFEMQFEDGSSIVPWVFEWVPKLPVELRPTHFGQGECARKKPHNEIANVRNFSRFVEKNVGGFWLYGDSFKIDITVFDKIPSRVDCWASWKDKRVHAHGPDILELGSEMGAQYGFACAWGEYEARNGYAYDYIEGGTCTGFCGRKYQRYVPGLYWLNYFSTGYIAQMELDVEGLASRLGGTALTVANGSILRLYDKPADWIDSRQEVEDAVFELKNFFSMRRVEFLKNPSKMNRKDFLWSPVEEWP